MLYSPARQLLFAHVSRTGGLAIVNALRSELQETRALLWQHAPLAAARPLLNRAFDAAFKFAVVRNPWDRFVSWYALIGRVTSGKHVDQARLIDPESSHWRAFDSFLEKWSSEEVQIEGVPRRRLSQWGQLADAEGRLLTNAVARFETLADDISRLFAELQLNFSPLPRINSSDHHHYSAYYSDYGRELVGAVFAEDVEQFGYRFQRVVE